LKDLG
jgi:hypothetical protein